MSFFTFNHIKISVILPVYNSEKYLKKCLDSILHQSIVPIEIIAINDCSTDNSLEILNKYHAQYPTLKIINNPINIGAGAARNLAINLAKGKYVAFIDSDDWFGEKYLECLYYEAEKTNADIVFSNMIAVDHNVENKYEGLQHLINKYYDTDISLIDLPNESMTAPWMKLFRKDFILRNKLKFLEGIKLGAEDVPFSWVSYFVAKNISFCENVYYFYNQIPDSLDRCINENILEIFDALNFTKNEYKKFDPSNSRYAQFDTLYISHTFYQFSKITDKNKHRNIELASLYWAKAHSNLINILPKSITENKLLAECQKEYYFDAIKHSSFDLEMQNKYFSDKLNKLH